MLQCFTATCSSLYVRSHRQDDVLKKAMAYPGILFGGVQQIQLRTEDSENGDLAAVAP